MCFWCVGYTAFCQCGTFTSQVARQSSSRTSYSCFEARFAIKLTRIIYGGSYFSVLTATYVSGDSSILEESLNPGLESIGVRVPDYDFIRAIARGSGSALALTSANLSGQPSSVSINDFEDLWQYCAYVYDGGLLPRGRAGSTIVDLTKPRTYKILIPGRWRACLYHYIILSHGFR